MLLDALCVAPALSIEQLRADTHHAAAAPSPQHTHHARSKRAFIVTDPPLFEMGMTNQIVNKLLPLGIQCKTFTNVEPDPTLAMVER